MGSGTGGRSSAAKAGVIGGSIGALTVAVGTWTAAYYLWKDALDQVEEFKTWLKDTDTLNQRTDKVNKDRADTHNAGVRALTEQTTDKSSPLAEILRGSFGQTTSAGPRCWRYSSIYKLVLVSF